MISRRHWISAMGAMGIARTWSGGFLHYTPWRRLDVPANFPGTEPKLVGEFVGAAHLDLPKVEEMLKVNPSFARATWDWGFGDWETAIGAASHTGRIDIVQCLLQHGAIPSIFTFATLDQVDCVRAICQGNLGAQSQLGPHGITLFKHAEAGKAQRVIEYLTELGGADQGTPHQVLEDSETKRYLGTYEFGPGPDDFVEILIGKSVPRLGFRRAGSSTRYLACVDSAKHQFSAFGSPQVQIVFELDGEQAIRFRLVDGAVQVVATRR